MSKLNITSVGDKLKVTLDGNLLTNVSAFSVQGKKGEPASVTLTFDAHVTLSLEKAAVWEPADPNPVPPSTVEFRHGLLSPNGEKGDGVSQ